MAWRSRGSPPLTSHGRAGRDYADAFVKRDGTWLFAERRLYVDWIEERVLS